MHTVSLAFASSNGLGDLLYLTRFVLVTQRCKIVAFDIFGS
jgi:hypothetical protein